MIKRILLGLGLAALTAMTASAGMVTYDTTGSTLFCDGVIGCGQITSSQISIGGLVLTYNPVPLPGIGVLTPSVIDLGNITATGTGANVNLSGILLTINVNSTPPGAAGTLPNGSISGSLSTSQSGASIHFSPNNTTTASFGTLPGVLIGNLTYQVLNTSLGVVSPTAGVPVGQTSILGGVSDTSAPEPSSVLLMSAGLGAFALRRKLLR
jgi:hypothetical protein